ncbi:hypothetical protein EIN_165280 [Entamoeba invadens IP1]|uniref:Uncharacterized protein n=1 Tax=Entamoeba invadens IP1 TaxID=370355 RepID=A0A0A1U4B2_ENTIV|nr:hypothetical protein EIN_165280 [Entamoeba invadens IP1]ELP89068.1 hypothetical protein EIN_165280 [Entamoeba invadens IP1]|eukprot:XP_004255839.1 hypothetical protein EIN_165280 [Entamoeba invadens IP1]
MPKLISGQKGREEMKETKEKEQNKEKKPRKEIQEMSSVNPFALDIDLDVPPSQLYDIGNEPLPNQTIEISSDSEENPKYSKKELADIKCLKHVLMAIENYKNCWKKRKSKVTRLLYEEEEEDDEINRIILAAIDLKIEKDKFLYHKTIKKAKEFLDSL